MTTSEAMTWAASMSETAAKNAERLAKAIETSKAAVASREAEFFRGLPRS